MKDFSSVLLINILRATVDHVQQSPEIDQASPGVKDLKRTLLEQILRLAAREPELARLATPESPQGAHSGIQ
jgi:hypothetical protein